MARGIPAPEHIKDPYVREFCTAIREAVEVLRGNVGNFDEKALTVKMLREIEVIGVDTGRNNTLFNPNAPAPAAFSTEAVVRATETITNNTSVVITDNNGSALVMQL